MTNERVDVVVQKATIDASNGEHNNPCNANDKALYDLYETVFEAALEAYSRMSKAA